MDLLGPKFFWGFVGLQHNEIKEGGVEWLRIDWGVASVQENKVPVKKQRGPQHRVKDSRSQVESSKLQSTKTKPWSWRRQERWRTKSMDSGVHSSEYYPGPGFIKLLKVRNVGNSTPSTAADNDAKLAVNSLCVNCKIYLCLCWPCSII